VIKIFLFLWKCLHSG